MSAPIRLFVGNLPEKIKENELRNAFSRFGEITALDIKIKPSVENDKKLFAFISVTGSNYDIESCIQHFTNVDLKGNRLYVTRARESFLERLQREREQAQRKEAEKNEIPTTEFKIKPLHININAHKRRFDTTNASQENGCEKKIIKKTEKQHHEVIQESKIGDGLILSKNHTKNGVQNFNNVGKKEDSDRKRLESMKKKRQEFNEKKMIIKTGLFGIDKVANKKVIFSDDDDNEKITHQNGFLDKNTFNNNDGNKRKRKLFDEGDDSDSEVNFKIKEQFEGKKGQKVLDLQSRYKSDKRFVLDERFIEDEKSDEEPHQDGKEEGVELGQDNEKYKQLNILQDVLGVPIKIKQAQDINKSTKSKLGMLRFDPTQPEHAKFLAPIMTKVEPSKKSKKKKAKETPEDELVPEEPKIIEKIEVSKEQFYKVTDTLKETLEQPNTFSLRSLFGQEPEPDHNEETLEQIDDQVTLPISKTKKVRNPLDPGEKNPFVYDSSDSENEESKAMEEITPQTSGPKPVWRENLFFSEFDERLKDGLLFFTQSNTVKTQKDRRELKSVMKKRVYNKERKNQMFQKKIGGKRKIAKKNFRKKT